MARKAKTSGEKPNTDPETAGAEPTAKPAEGIRPEVEKTKADPDVAATSEPLKPERPGASADARKSAPKPAAKKTDEPAKPDGAAPATSPDKGAGGKDAKPPEAPRPAGTADPVAAKQTTASKPSGPPDRPTQSSSASGAPASEAPARRSVWPMLFAGVFTAAVGFGAAYYLLGDGGPLGGTRLTEAEARLATLEAQLAETKAAQTKTAADLAKAAPLAATEALGTRLDQAEADLEALRKSNADAIAALAAKLDDLRQRPAATDPAATAAYERELAAMREMFDAELAKIRTAADEASKAQAAAAAAGADAETLAALSAVETALDSGSGFAEALDHLAALRPELSVEAMRDFADGVDSLSSLQADFPDAARAAIDADIAAGNGEAGLTGFLKSQLGMRSLAPKDGDSVDAVLSRAEAKLRNGDLVGAVAEADALTGPSVDALAPWRSRADRRLAALAAFGKLSDEVRN